MGTFNTKKTLLGSPTLIPQIADAIQNSFLMDGYKVACNQLNNGGADLSVTKGGMFKAVLGMRTALKVTLLPQNGSIRFEAGVGIWGQQVIPTVISMLFFWPVLITQIWGMIEQAKLDDKALQIAQNIVLSEGEKVLRGSECSCMGKFCTNCGHPVSSSAKFCSECGYPL